MHRNILICPLDWGTGHATRMVPLAGMLNEKGFAVFVAVPLKLASLFDPNIFTVIPLSSYSIKYPARLPLALTIALQLPLLAVQAAIDRIRIARLVKKYNIGVIISDNRFGCRKRGTRSIFITHQVNIMSPFRVSRRSWLLSTMHSLFVTRHDECWIPDLPGPANLSGELSHPPYRNINCRYIGTLSRFKNVVPEPPEGLPDRPFTLLILSGPEPARTHFGTTVTRLFNGSDRHLVIAGNNPSGKENPPGNITIMGFTGPATLASLVEKSEMIVCRSGYSTIMDLAALKRSALLVPTPGQPEQEYLARYLSVKGYFSMAEQSEITIKDIEDYSEKRNIKNIPGTGEDDLLEKASGEFFRTWS